MSLVSKLTPDNKSFSRNSNAGAVVYVGSDEIIDLAITERTSGRVIEVIKPPVNPRIMSARAKDLNLGVFVSYGARA